MAALLWLVACVLLLPSVSDLLSLAQLLRRRAPRHSPAATALPRLVFLVPAHDEELLIGSCLRALSQMRYPAARLDIVVVADNCSDRTATIARTAGFRCLERRDPDRPGKPYAIAWALGQLPLETRDAVVIVDADTVVDPECAAALAGAAPLPDKVVQCYNGVWNRTDNALTRMAAVLSTAMHRFAFGLKTKAGVNVPLSAGMCLGTNVLATYGWSAFSIGEDWEMYALLVAQGVRTESVPAARIFAQEARSLRQSASQRRRWTAGKLTVLLRCGRMVVRSRRIGFAQKLDSLAELGAPGPALHLGTVASAVTLSALFRPPGAFAISVALAVSLLRWATYTVAAVRADPEPTRAALAFALLPFYAVWRAGAALAALTMLGDQPWVRTERMPQPNQRAHP